MMAGNFLKKISRNDRGDHVREREKPKKKCKPKNYSNYLWIGSISIFCNKHHNQASRPHMQRNTHCAMR